MWTARVFCFCIYTACLRDTCCAKIGYEGKDITFKAMYPPDYETNTKYFGRTHDFFSFEKLVETSHPNRWVKQGRYILFDNTSAHFLTARILRLVAGDSGSYSLGVDIKLLPDFIADEIQLTVITGEAQRPTTPAPKVIVYSTSSPATITARNWTKTRDQESFLRLVTVLSLVCVCTLLVVCPFVLFKVVKWATTYKLSASVSFYNRKTSAQVVDEYVNMSSIELRNSPTADKASVVEDFHRDENLNARYTEMSSDFVQETIYQSIDY